MKLGKKLLSIVLAAVLCLSMVPSAFADNSLGVTYQAKLSASELTQSTEAQEVVLEINANSVITYDSIGAEIKIPSGWELTAIANKEVTLLSSEYTLKAADGTGSIGFQSRSGDNETITNICVLTYKVPANAAPGVYQLGIEKLEIAKDYGTDIWEKSGAITATLTIKGNTPAHEHVWSAAWSKDATHHWHDCTATGCDVTVNADKNGYAAHNYNKKVTTKDYLKTAANCTDAAVYYYSCECGAIGTKTFTEGTALGHNPSTEWSKDATHHWHVCTTCNADLDKEAHNPGPAPTETTPQTCTVCGYEIAPVLPHTHDYVEVVDGKYLKTAAGCENDAVYYKSCSKCHEAGTETFTVADTALGHSYTAEKVADQYLKDAAGCETDAVYFKSCARCGDKGTETFTVANSALGHVQASPWNHNADEHWQVCTRCSKDFHKAAHNGGTATCQEKAKCEICGAAYGKLGEHNFDTKWTSDDTYHYHKCLTAGCTEKADDAAEHTSTGDNIANCLHKAKCDVCGAAYGNLGAHTLTKTAAKAPTCLEAGNNEYYTCSVCGKVFKDAAGTTETTVAAETLAKSTTHSVVKGEYATSATEHWQICKVCGTVVGKAAHKFGEADANGRKTCADCGYTVGGTGTEGHKHAAGNATGYDENNHWNKCTDANCDAHVNETKHTFTTVSTTKEGNTTITVEQCQCGYVKRTETTTGGTTPVNPGGNKPTKPGTKDNSKTVQSGKTFDAGVGVYVGLSILSLTGSAVVIGKKRKTR